MKTTGFASVLILSLALGSAGAPARANDDKKTAAIVGALAILGIAAMAHNQNHYHDGQAPQDANATAAFERGYRDGLHNEPYDSAHSSAPYGQGYDAGQKERSNRLAHKRNDVGGTKVPRAAINACVSEVAASLNVGGQDVHVIKAGQEGSDSFYIGMAAGHNHVTCGTNSAGQVFNLRNGRL